MLAIIPLILKALTVAEAVWENRDLAMAALNSIKNIIAAHKNGTVTPEMIAQTESELDAMLAEFNAPLP